MENFTTIPDDIVSLRHHREQANKTESILVANINRNAKLLVELAATLDLTSVPCKEAFADLYTGYVATVGIMHVIDTAYEINNCLLYTSPSPRDQRGSRMPSSA